MKCRSVLPLSPVVCLILTTYCIFPRLPCHRSEEFCLFLCLDLLFSDSSVMALCGLTAEPHNNYTLHNIHTSNSTVCNGKVTSC